MHFPTPLLKKSEKRKASLDAGGGEPAEGVVLEKKETRRERKAKRSKAVRNAEQEEEVQRDGDMMPEEPNDVVLERTTSPLTLERTTSSTISPTTTTTTTTRRDSVQESPHKSNSLPTPTKTHSNNSAHLAKTNTNTQDPESTTERRRSSRIRNSMHSVANTWTKARPYIERLNGTVMPLKPQGAEAYYARDGVKVD